MKAQLDSTDSEAFHSTVFGLQEKVDALLRQAATLKEMYKHSKASFDYILATMHQEIYDFANQASCCLCNEYKHHSFDRIVQDHLYMDVTPFMSNVIQNVSTFDALLTSHQLGWSIVPLQILMALILMEAAATLCHLEFVQYLTEWSLHVQRSSWVSNTTPRPVPAPHPVGVNLESEQENPSSSRPKTSDPDSPETCPTPHSNPPVMPSKPLVMPTKPETMLSKTPGATPTRKHQNPRRPSHRTLIVVNLKTCVGSSAQPTKEEIKKHQCWHTDKWASNLPGIQSYQQRKGIILDNPPPNDYKDHSDYIRQVLHNNESAGLSIHHIPEKQYSKDTSSTGQKRYEAVKTLSGMTMGKS